MAFLFSQGTCLESTLRSTRQKAFSTSVIESAGITPGLLKPQHRFSVWCPHSGSPSIVKRRKILYTNQQPRKVKILPFLRFHVDYKTTNIKNPFFGSYYITKNKILLQKFFLEAKPPDLCTSSTIYQYTKVAYWFIFYASASPQFFNFLCFS